MGICNFKQMYTDFDRNTEWLLNYIRYSRFDFISDAPCVDTSKSLADLICVKNNFKTRCSSRNIAHTERTILLKYLKI